MVIFRGEVKWPAHKHCEDTSITTASGKFTFYTETDKTRAEAKKLCEEKGEILAPITNRADLEALHKFATGCTNLGIGRSYFVGLEMIDKDTRWFTNGVVYKEEVHGSFNYVYNVNGKLPACWETYFSTREAGFRGMHTIYNRQCYPTRNEFICLKPAVNSSACN